ncbi:Permease of the drug/metabolite transporter (DMT) superfamily [Chitinophaga terrae (ex Kim and Jung 2007)]|uniref:Permease of the drug/metabolite transporter (DMT) superfamily n=1 Tax=Chitinophaga terrae (ex Kim and Jung 2007) TaxID=408074 RepID=A0A1H4B7P9_9BACT|nr:EamA family transporter [Chitinophaga terrae (ex Kim and Jung 2007)]GEP91215.1 drug/metabolite exporter YedA [Chitinophaga terrae (ex Kim and Jung 2007)]SEA44150.1 Permease of the drug/metabolite transporter (DMT) superfamily [Chitinophaga terrae (ex Kim and Jung 2007)]
MTNLKGNYASKLVACLLAVYIIWGSTYLGMKIATGVIPPFMLSAVRFLLAGAIMLTIGIIKEKTWPERKQLLSAMLIGVMLIGMGNTVTALGVHYMPSGLVALLVAAVPAWIIGFDWAFFSKQRPSTLTLLGIGVGFCGLFLLFNPFGSHHETREYPLWPVAVVTGGCISWALGTLLIKRLPMPAQLTGTGIQMFTGGVFALLLSFLMEPGAINTISQNTSEGILAYFYLVFVGSLVGFGSYSWLSKNAPPRLTATYAYVNPIVALILGFLVGKEALSPIVGVAAAIVISGVVLMTLGKKTSK